jgi:hypothetical protein
VWGQSRLPNNPADFSQKFEITPARNNTNAGNFSIIRLSSSSLIPHVSILYVMIVSIPIALPVSHTCFFSLELPRYTEREAMRSRILYAIQHCTSIDTDFNPTENVNWDAE